MPQGFDPPLAATDRRQHNAPGQHAAQCAGNPSGQRRPPGLPALHRRACLSNHSRRSRARPGQPRGIAAPCVVSCGSAPAVHRAAVGVALGGRPRDAPRKRHSATQRWGACSVQGEAQRPAVAPRDTAEGILTGYRTASEAGDSRPVCCVSWRMPPRLGTGKQCGEGRSPAGRGAASKPGAPSTIHGGVFFQAASDREGPTPYEVHRRRGRP